MNELKHWLDDTSEADEFERSILRAGQEADPSQAKRDQIWTELMGTLAVAPLAAASSSAQASSVQAASAKAAVVGASKAAGVGLAVGKGLLVGLTLYGAAQGVTELTQRLSARHEPVRPAAQAETPARGTEPAAAASSTGSSPLPSATSEAALTVQRPAQPSSSSNTLAAQAKKPVTALPSVAAFDVPERPEQARVSQLEAETRALRLARDELRAGKLADAFATLEASRRQFAAPELYQEREALMIELLYRSGQTSAAEQRASAFLSRFPDSPHVQQIRRFTRQ